MSQLQGLSSPSNRLGRSGPRSKTGCLTCRKRKVRCDEARPVCVNCSRLRIHCHFARGGSLRPLQPQPRGGTEEAHVLHERVDASAPLMPCSSSSGEPLADMSRASITSPMRGGSSVESADELDYSLTFERLQDELLSLSPMFVEQSWEPVTATSNPNVNVDESLSLQSPLSGDVPETNPQLPVETDRLQAHFLSLESPPRFILSIEDSWEVDRDTIFKMGGSCPSLMDAICSFADAHLAYVQGSNPTVSSNFYKKASLQVQQAMAEELYDNKIQQLLATILLLIYVELLLPAASKTKGLSAGDPQLHLRTVHLVLHKYRSRFDHWKGIGRRLIVWLEIFDHKAMFAGRGISPSDHTSTRPGDAGRVTKPHTWDAHESVDTGALLFSMINQPAFTFYLETQKLGDQMTLMNKWNRARGSLNDEIEVLQAGKSIDAALEAHWADRPPVLDQCLSADMLLDSLQESLARRFSSRIRLYRAHYFAHVIYLHRVAFRVFAKEEKVEKAISEVARLATIESSGGCLSPSWLWPLFMVAVEGSQANMAWVQSEFGRMIATNDVDHVLASNALQILTTLDHRIQAGARDLDYRMIADELFNKRLQVM